MHASFASAVRLVESSLRSTIHRTNAIHPFSSLSSRVEIDKHSNNTAASLHDQSYDTESATALVDSLLRHTESLVTQQSSSQHHFIAFSGGVDSSLTAALVYRVAMQLGLDLDVRAVLGVSAAVPAEQRELAVAVADQIGIPLQLVDTNEGTDPVYIANAGQACLACKTHLYSTLQAIVNHVEADHDERIQLYNGTNADDVQDSTRVGLIAAERFHVISPLRHTNKHLIRVAARHLGLLNWNYAASPCLRSRLALGVPATNDHLERMERAERFVRNQLLQRAEELDEFLFDETSNLRVRLLSKNRVCIEVDPGDALEYVQRHVDQWKEYYFEKEFSSVLVREFRSGSVATRAAATSEQ